MSVPISLSPLSHSIPYSNSHFLPLGHRAPALDYRAFDASIPFEGPRWSPLVYRPPVTSMSPISGAFPLSPAIAGYRNQSDGFCASSQNFHAPHPVRAPSHDDSLVAANQLQSKIGPTRTSISDSPDTVSSPHHNRLPEYMTQREGASRSRSSTPAHPDTLLHDPASDSRAVASPISNSSRNHASSPDQSYQSMIYHADTVPLQNPAIEIPPPSNEGQDWRFNHGPLTAWRPRRQRQKHRKQRLFNVDRKAICEYHRANPTARQEDIAVRYGVERSTISKILKEKERWLNVPDDGFEKIRVSKQRPSKFPQIEQAMLVWMQTAEQALTDNLLRTRAREIAREYDIDPDVFKASAGWVENFKQRHGIRGGVWHGDGKAMFSPIGSYHPKSPTKPPPEYFQVAAPYLPKSPSPQQSEATVNRPAGEPSPTAGPSGPRSRGSSPETAHWNPLEPRRVPSAEEAEDCLKKVALFFNVTGKDILSDEQHAMLDQIRSRLQEINQTH